MLERIRIGFLFKFVYPYVRSVENAKTLKVMKLKE